MQQTLQEIKKEIEMELNILNIDFVSQLTDEPRADKKGSTQMLSFAVAPNRFGLIGLVAATGAPAFIIRNGYKADYFIKEGFDNKFLEESAPIYAIVSQSVFVKFLSDGKIPTQASD